MATERTPPPKRIRLGDQHDNIAPVITRGRRSRWHEDVYHSVLQWPWWQFFGFVCICFLGMNAVFALLYMLEPGSIAGARPGFEDAFFFSVQTLATIGYGAMSPATLFGHVIVTLEALTGILSVALITGIAFARFARPTSRVLFSNRVVVTRRNGVPHMMFRMANWRGNMVVEAQLRVILLVDETTAEGERMRRTGELSLVKDRTAMFILSWSAMHLIDESSPFYGEGALEKLRGLHAEMILSLSGLDETFGQTIHARHRYTLDDIAWDSRFTDVLTLKPDGTRVLDYSKFHDVEPLP